jgi:hypothetical protein
MTEPTAAPPQYSPDGRWWWDGTTWLAVPATPPPPTGANAPAGMAAQVSSGPVVEATSKSRLRTPTPKWVQYVVAAVLLILVVVVGRGIVNAHRDSSNLQKSNDCIASNLANNTNNPC